MEMTVEEKIEWLKNATPAELVEMIRSTVISAQSDYIPAKIEAENNYKLVKAEIVARLSKEA